MYAKVSQPIGGLSGITDLLTAGMNIYQQYTQQKVVKKQIKEIEVAKQQAAKVLELQATVPSTTRAQIMPTGIPTSYVLLGGGALLALALLLKR